MQNDVNNHKNHAKLYKKTWKPCKNHLNSYKNGARTRARARAHAHAHARAHVHVHMHVHMHMHMHMHVHVHMHMHVHVRKNDVFLVRRGP